MKIKKEWSKEGKNHVLTVRYTNVQMQGVLQSFRAPTKEQAEKLAKEEIARNI